MALPNFNIKDIKAFPHGKAPNIVLPPDWTEYAGNLSKFVKQKNGDSVADGAFGGPLSITTVPPRTHSGEDDPAGHTEFLYLSEETKSKVFNYPGFPQPVNTPSIPKYEVREAPGKGRGVYATCDMYPGDLIWAERALIVTTVNTVSPNGLLLTGSHHTEEQLYALKHYAAERTIEAIVNRLTPERKARFMSLANSHKEDGSGPCIGIVRTNQLGIRMVEGEPGPDPQKTFWRYTAVGDILSLSNHSCIPNIRNAFDPASFSLQIYALARIKKGDELVWSYVGDANTAAEREKGLSPYGFRCKCRICVDPKADALRTSYADRSYVIPASMMIYLLKHDLDDPFHKKSAAGKEARLKDYNIMITQLESLRRESDSYGYAGQLRLVCLLHELYKRVGNETKRRRYVTLVIRSIKCENIRFRPYL